MTFAEFASRVIVEFFLPTQLVPSPPVVCYVPEVVVEDAAATAAA